MNLITSRRIVVVTARGRYGFSTSGRFIESGALRTSARSPEGARLACFTLAGEADAAALRALRWAAAMLLYLFRHRQPEPPDSPAALPSRDERLMAETGEATPLRAWQAKYAAWAVEHPLAA